MSMLRALLPPHFLPSFTRHVSVRHHSVATGPLPGDKIFVALSSGLDSTVSASLLLRSHPPENLYPIYLQNWAPSQHPPPAAAALGPFGKPLAPNTETSSKPGQQQQPKCIDREFARVREICAHLRLPNEPRLLQFEKEYWNDVFAPMLSSYEKGDTPNPDVGCNREIKFGALARRIGAEIAGGERWWLATGHYARAVGGRLLRSGDPGKDQTYFLSTVPAEVLQRCVFPLGDAGLVKSQVKEIARKLEVPGWREGEMTRESFGLCFVEPAGGRNSGFRRFLGEYLPPAPGNIVVGESRETWPDGAPILMPPPGTVVAKHEGLWHATVGEKAHLQLPQGSLAFQGRWYVSRKNPEKNQIEVVKGGNNRALFSRAMAVGDWRWLGDDAEKIATAKRPDEAPAAPAGGSVWEPGLVAQFRHLQKPLKVKAVTVLGDGKGPGTRRVSIVFDTPQKAVTVGQSAAMWDGERCLGGGVIDDTEPV
ncbi:tRNA-specific 2-thiouridylase [Sphaerosporella brunnea]|uniref:tRNA-5-taurinomethyluridine 2-sulfurtransferase n=1 Tax=Sphaerosporella brunnea TaxID=1250544 RepID=A0A5J5EU43_9PEZI|nr:tRNA-specific 2-thiouridylase [Sphaerosporella brunnea]